MAFLNLLNLKEKGGMFFYILFSLFFHFEMIVYFPIQNVQIVALFVEGAPISDFQRKLGFCPNHGGGVLLFRNPSFWSTFSKSGHI